MDQPQASAEAQVGNEKEYTQVPSPESVDLNKPQEPVVPSHNKGELNRKIRKVVKCYIYAFYPAQSQICLSFLDAFHNFTILILHIMALRSCYAIN